jgi:predicted ATP-grasp superfamily ATP-dependent carboligase
VPLWLLHVEACRGTLPERDLPLPARTYGKAVLWARRGLVMPDTRPWLERDDVRDVPHPGEPIRHGHPVCTVFARAKHLARCQAALFAAARNIEREIGLSAERVPA